MLSIFPFGSIERYSSIIIMNFGGAAEDYIDQIKRTRWCTVVCVLDSRNSPDNAIPSYGYPVYLPSKIAEITGGDYDYVLICAAEYCYDAVNAKKYLMSKGVPENKIICRRDRDIAHHTGILQRLTEQYTAARYLEIGVSRGKNFSEIPAAYKTGVDPIPPTRMVKREISETCAYRAVTSDEFFHSIQNTDTLYDVIFIDGLHEYKQTYRDIVNALAHLSEGGVIVIHDCLPETETMQVTPEERIGCDEWTGDVWKAVVKLRAGHPELNVFTLCCDYGCAVVTRGAPESMLGLKPEETDSLTYSDLKINAVSYLNLKPLEHLMTFIRGYYIQRNKGARLCGRA